MLTSVWGMFDPVLHCLDEGGMVEACEPADSRSGLLVGLEKVGSRALRWARMMKPLVGRQAKAKSPRRPVRGTGSTAGARYFREITSSDCTYGSRRGCRASGS
jgi:hypothetical protein